MTANEIVKELEKLGNPQTKKTWMNYGAQEPCFGVKVEDMKRLMKGLKGNYPLALELYATGIADAQYMAGLFVDDRKMTKADLKQWLDTAAPGWVVDFTVPWVAASSNHGHELALEWLNSKDEVVQSIGWSTYSSFLTITSDSELDLEEIRTLLDRVATTIHNQSDTLKPSMNQFVTFVGSYVLPLHEYAVSKAKEIGKVTVHRRGGCALPVSSDQIAKVIARGSVGKKRKSAKC